MANATFNVRNMLYNLLNGCSTHEILLDSKSTLERKITYSGTVLLISESVAAIITMDKYTRFADRNNFPNSITKQMITWH